jgi:hypothetical protein
MILTMESLTPLFGEAVARVLVDASVFERSKGRAQPLVDALFESVCALRDAGIPTTCEPHEVEEVRLVEAALANAGAEFARPEHRTSYRAKLLCDAYANAKRAVDTANGCTDAVAVTLRYQLAQANKHTARERYDAAGPALDLASIRERLAEIECQRDPAYKIIVEDLLDVTPDDGGMSDALYRAVRRACCRVAFYVVIGRVPERKGA